MSAQERRTKDLAYLAGLLKVWACLAGFFAAFLAFLHHRGMTLAQFLDSPGWNRWIAGGGGFLIAGIIAGVFHATVRKAK